MAPTAVQIAMEAGFGRFNATSTIPFMWFTPSNSDPLSPTIIQMINMLQRNLIAMGVPTQTTGVVDPHMIAALDEISGAWKQKAWIRIFQDVIAAKKAGWKYRQEKPMGYYLGDRGYGSLGAIAQTGWCSDTNPQSGCKSIKGVCLPMDRATLDVFKALQTEVNRALGRSELAVDGRIGPATSAAVTKVLGTPFLHCDQLAAVADGTLTTLRELNSKQSKPPVAPKPPSRIAPPSVVRADGSVDNPSSAAITAAGFANKLASPIGLIGVGAGVLLFMSTRKKKSARRKRR